MMDKTWLKKARIVARVDRIIMTIEPATAIDRREFIRHLPMAWHSQVRDLGGAGVRFQITVQDPQSIPAIVAVIDRMHLHRLRLRGEPSLDLLEVAVDVEPKEPGSLDLARIAADLFKGAKFEPSANTRAAGESGQTIGLHGHDPGYRALNSGRSLYNGNKYDPCMVRCYVKVKDNGVDLPVTRHRARFEVQLQGEALPVRRVRDLTRFRFENLSRMFLARTLRDDLTPSRLMIAERVHKLRRSPRKGVMGRTARSFSDQAFAAYNRRVYRALVSLSGQMHDGTRSPYHAAHLSALLGPTVMPARILTSLVGVTKERSVEEHADSLTTLLIGGRGHDDDRQEAA
jgi:hypothetical protein